MNEDLGPLELSIRSGEESLTQGGQPIGKTLLDFWRWSGSDLTNNKTRAVFAEYLVACALGVTGIPRKEWSNYDLLTRTGIKVEVRSAAYIQSWSQKRLSTIGFGISPRYSWDDSLGRKTEEKKRHADVYVFALLDHTNQKTLDPLKLDQWVFHVLSTKDLHEYVGDQDRLTLSQLMKLEPRTVQFDGIADAIEQVGEDDSAPRQRRIWDE